VISTCAAVTTTNATLVRTLDIATLSSVKCCFIINSQSTFLFKKKLFIDLNNFSRVSRCIKTLSLKICLKRKSSSTADLLTTLPPSTTSQHTKVPMTTTTKHSTATNGPVCFDILQECHTLPNLYCAIHRNQCHKTCKMC